MNVKHLLIAIVGVAMVREISQADSPAPPRAYVTASRLGRYFFKMIPEKGHREGDKYFVDRAAFGVAYEVDSEGEFKEIWRSSGWYCFEAFLSEDGKYLVRMGPWNGGREPAKGDLAVAFYENGKLLKEYSTADLVDDTSKVIVSTSHYRWLARDKELFEPKAKPDPEATLKLDWKNVFHLKTIDGVIYKFDATSGAIKEKKKS